MNPWIALSIWLLGWCIASLPPYFAKKARRASKGKALPWGAEFTFSGALTSAIGALVAFSQNDSSTTLYSYAPSDVISLLAMGIAASGAGNWVASRSRDKENPQDEVV